jgi:hypothetical protein
MSSEGPMLYTNPSCCSALMPETSILGRIDLMEHIQTILWGSEHHLCVLLVLSSVVAIYLLPG